MPAGLIQVGSRLPEWLRGRSAHHPSVTALKRDLRRLHLHTVCESARCPNLHECFHRGTATFLILGDRCTRGCGFCSVAKESPFALDPDEPANVARMAARMGLRYVVVTSVTRDDLADGGSAHFAETVRRVRQALPEARVEVLTPDFGGDLDAVARVVDVGPEVFNHNLETVERLYHRVRPRADYLRSLEVLRFAKRRRPEALTKSGLMVGLGETPAEVEASLGGLRRADVDIVTIGQYLQPARRNLPVAEYVTPGQFEAYRRCGLSLGFPTVFSGPLVRSSYMADRQGALRHSGAAQIEPSTVEPIAEVTPRSPPRGHPVAARKRTTDPQQVTEPRASASGRSASSAIGSAVESSLTEEAAC